jgi:hypothetical protein
MLLVVLLIFYILGCIVKVILDKNFKEMQKEETTDGEDLLEEEAEDAEQGKEEVEEEKVQE